jgi:hypothetical protein
VRGLQREEQLGWVERAASSLGVPTVDILRVFRSTNLPIDSLYLLPHDGHASPYGNRLAATAVTDRLTELGVCDGAAQMDWRAGMEIEPLGRPLP